jgi:uncharacterized membrane protein
MPESFTIAVSTRAPRPLVWSVFADIENWHTMGKMYRAVEWKAGKPWAKGSHFVAELLHPVEVTVDHRILACVPAERVNWSVHAIGVTIERLIEFKDSVAGTQIKTSALIAGKPTRDIGGELGELLNQYSSQWYQDLAAACDARAVK